MIKIIEIIKKNFRLLLRSRTSALIVLLGPLILMLLIGFAFNTTSLFDIKIGTYSSSYSELSSSIITKLEDDQFTVVKVDSEQKCIDMIKSNDVHVCTIFPPNLNVRTSDKITFYVDKSRLNFVYIILDRISSKIATKSTELSTALTNRLLTSITNTNAKLGSAKTISSDLESSSSSVAKVTSDISSIDTSVTEANFTGVKDEIKNVQDKNNFSSSMFTKLRSLITDIETQYGSAVAKITSIASIKDSSSKSLNEVKAKLSGNIQDAKEIEKNIKEVRDDINSIEIKDVSRIVSPISTEIKPVSAESTNLSYTFPTLVLLVILFAGLFLGSTSVMEEKMSKAYFRNFITPTKDILFVVAQYISNIMIVLLQLIIIFGVMLFITKASIAIEVLLNIFLILLLSGSVFVLFGMLIGYLFKSSETANIGAISIGSLLLFFSNTILPIETLPRAIRNIVQFNPFIVGESSLKKIILFNEPLMNILTSIYILAGFVVLLFILAYVTRELTKRQLS